MRLLVFCWLAATAFAEPMAWKLEPSDFLRFDRRPVKLKDGKESFGAPNFVTIYGHQTLGQFAPVSPGRPDLAALFAFRLPGGKKSFKLALRGTIALKVRGDVALDGEALLGNFRFESRGKPNRDDTHEILDGHAATRMSFDKERGLFTGGRVEMRYTLRKLKPKPGERPKDAAFHYDFALKAVERGAGKDLREQVNAAIDKGVEKLGKLQNEQGRWKPHGDHDVGTTSLVILTLAACEVQRDDARLKRALAWLFRQTPDRTYDRSVALMAVDRAFTPKSELVAVHRGKLVAFERKLTPEQRAWCHRTAKALEDSATGPGTWGYPPVGRVIVRADTSNSQYAVLGLRAASRLGYTVRERTWLGVIRHYQQHRARDGRKGEVALLREGEALKKTRRYPVKNTSGYRYNTRKFTGWASMACAAITSLAIARDELARQKSNRLTAALEDEIDQLILGAWAWLDQHWAVDRHPGHPSNSHLYYYLYSLERAAVLDRVKRVGHRDWYTEGARQLLARQERKKGAWGDGVVKNCFALLFLRRATTPLPPITGTD